MEKSSKNKRETTEILVLLLLLLCGCLLVWNLNRACSRLRLKTTDGIMAVEGDDDEFMSDTETEETADDHHADEGRRQIAKLKRAIRKNRTREREMKSAIQEEAFLEAWHKEGRGYQCLRYILSGEIIDVQRLMELTGASKEDCEEALEVFQKRTLKSLIELRQQELDQTFEKLEAYLKRTDLSHLSLAEQESLQTYKEAWKAWVSGAYQDEKSLEEKMELFQSLKKQDDAIQAMMIRNLDHVHQFPVAAYIEKMEKARDAFHPLFATRGSTHSVVIEDPEKPGCFRRLFITF